uniref:BAHD-type malonyltransferase 3 n=1 Tax=Digitalis lanata TaxID=49450 RepID=A0A8F2DDV3_DIGLA|nr:BAHD-type malonyltransferase 3 [Digitalis lanata]
MKKQEERASTTAFCLHTNNCEEGLETPSTVLFSILSQNWLDSMVKVTVHEQSRVAPASGGETAKQSLPVTYFDMFWIHFHPIQRLLFYKFPCSRVHFLETIVPNLKNSLSKTLKHYLPLAGNLLVPLNSCLPEFRYLAGDSVSVTIAESSDDFDFEYWTGNQARDADEFYAFVPHLPEPTIDSGFKIMALVSIQVTLFPGTGICVGFTNHHAVGDASSIVRFIKCWSSVANLGEDTDDEFLTKKALLPILDRSVIQDPSSRRANIFWSQLEQWVNSLTPPKFPTNSFRETFVLQKTHLQKLRNSVLAKKPYLTHLSSYTVSTAYVWSCLAKIDEEVDENEPEYFVIAVDARQRLDPPVPLEYFGNCLAGAVTESTHGELKGEEGFCSAVELIGEVISKVVNNKDELMKDADEWIVKFGPIMGKRNFGVSGSPKFDLYDTDFGWGKPSKFEAVSIDGDPSMSLCKSREFEGGLEIGLSMPKLKLDAFAAIFAKGLEE